MHAEQMLNGLTYSLYPDKATPWSPDRTVQLVNSILDTFTPVLLTVAVGEENGVVGGALQVTDLSGSGMSNPRDGAALMKTTYPNLHVKGENASYFPQQYPYHSVVLPLRTYGTADVPILYPSDIRADADPLSTLFQVGVNLLHEEQVRLHIVVNRRHKPTFHKGAEIWGVFQRGREAMDRKTYARSQTGYERITEGKRDAKWFECYLTCEIYTPDASRINVLAPIVFAQLRHFGRDLPNQPQNGLTIWEQGINMAVASDHYEAVGNSILGPFLSSHEGDQDARNLLKRCCKWEHGIIQNTDAKCRRQAKSAIFSAK